MSEGCPYDFELATAALASADPRLGREMRRLGPCGLDVRSTGSAYQTLAKAIIYQQLSGKAAETIHGRVRALFPRRQIRPARLLELSDEALRSAGLSRAKLAAMRDLSEKALRGKVPSVSRMERMDDDEIIERLVAIRGIGVWSAQMLLIFRLGRPDVLPATDLGIRKGYMILRNLREMPEPRKLTALTEAWRPWRSVASWYLYRLVDEEKEPS